MRKRHSLYAATALALGGTLAAPALAQDNADDEVIVVWGNRLEESLALELADYGSRVETITAQEIEDGGFIDSIGALEDLVPGLYLVPKNGPFDYVNLSLQGSRTKDVIWLIDGVRITNRLYDTTTPLDTIPAHMIERIEVLKGGQSLFYGTQAVAGAINIVTRDFSDETDGELTLGMDSNEGTTIGGHARGAVGPHRFVLFGSADQSDGFQPFRDEDYQPSATDRDRGYDVVTLGAKYGINLTDDLLASAIVQHTDATLDFAEAFRSYSVFNKRDEDIVSGKVDWTPSEQLSFYVKGYYHWWDTNFSRINNTLDASGALTGDLTVVSNKAFWGFEDYGVNVLGEYEASDALTLLLGYDYQSYEGVDEEFLIAETNEEVHALFGQARLDLDILEGARLSAGVRHNKPSEGEEKTVWNVSGEIDLTDSFYARGQVGTSFRLPTAYELFVIDPCCEQGNPNLVGEESFNLEAGVGGDHGRLNWEVMAFHRTIDDLIDIDFDNPAFPDGVLANFPDEVEVNGAEVIVNAAATDAINLTFDYTHTDAKMNGEGPQLLDIPVDFAKVIAGWNPNDLPFGATATLNLVGEVTDRVSIGPAGARVSTDVEHGDYAVLDLAGYWFLDEDERHRLGIRLANALDEEYATQIRTADADGSSPVLRYPVESLGQPRTLYVNYTLDF
jgi:vitamin B12 transporter